MCEHKLIRILHVIGVMDRGGAETMIMNLYRKIDRTKVQFDFVVHNTKQGAYDAEIMELGGKIFHCPQYRPQSLIAYLRWWTHFFSNQGKEHRIVHGHIGSSAAVYLSIAKHFGKITIAHSHSSGTDHSIGQLLYRISAYPTRFIAEYFFACSNVAGIDRYGKNIVKRKGKYFVINNAVDVGRFGDAYEVRDKTREMLGFANEETVIGHVGRFVSVKNHTFVLKVFAESLKLNSNLRLMLVGDGPLRGQIEKEAEDLGITEKIQLIGVREDVPELMAAMDVFLFPSLYEGLGIVLIEAQVSGLPCVISDAIPSESVLVPSIIKSVPLTCSVDEWAQIVLEMMAFKRHDYRHVIVEKGYDINETSKWLQSFYVEKSLNYSK